jgi:hypothetical protein
MVAPVYNSNTCEAEAGGSQVQGQPGLQQKIIANIVHCGSSLAISKTS